MARPFGSARPTTGPDPIIVKLELAGYSTDSCFGRYLIRAVEPVSMPAALRLRQLLVRPSNGADTVKPALWRVVPGQVDVVTLVPTPDTPVRPETIERLFCVDEALREISWVFHLMRVAKGYRFCAEVDLLSARITAAAERRRVEDGVVVKSMTRRSHSRHVRD